MRLSFIIIDDRELDCYIAEKIIHKTGLSAETKIFYNAFSGLDFIKNTPVTDHIIVVLLDIMMPVMNGFQFMEAFEKLPEETRNNYRIVAITTSLNKNDISDISNYQSVIGVLKKPYTSEALVKALQTVTRDLGQ